MMRLLGIPAQTGEGIAAAATDWIDSDQKCCATLAVPWFA